MVSVYLIACDGLPISSWIAAQFTVRMSEAIKKARKRLNQILAAERRAEEEERERLEASRERERLREEQERILQEAEREAGKQTEEATREASGGTVARGRNGGRRTVEDNVFVEVPMLPNKRVRFSATTREAGRKSGGHEAKGGGTRKGSGNEKGARREVPCNFCKSRGLRDCYTRKGSTSAGACWMCYKQHISCLTTDSEMHGGRREGDGVVAGASGTGSGAGLDGIAEAIRDGFAEANSLLQRGVEALESLGEELAGRCGSDVGSEPGDGGEAGGTGRLRAR